LERCGRKVCSGMNCTPWVGRRGWGGELEKWSMEKVGEGAVGQNGCSHH
jgi:hypothetical protein